MLQLNELVSNFSERRVEQRYSLEEVIALKIIFASENPALLGKSILGSTVDVSSSGLKITLQEEVSLNSTVDVNVTLRKNFKQYYLSGKVRWCEQISDSKYLVGVSLHDVSGTETDFKSWRNEFN